MKRPWLYFTLAMLAFAACKKKAEQTQPMLERITESV